MAFDRNGDLIVCEHLSSSVVRIRSDGSRQTVCFHFDGTYLNSPNDVVVGPRDGQIYFTDPTYGRDFDVGHGIRPSLLGFKGVYRVPPGGGPAELLVERDEFGMPNGLCFSPDGTRLYVNDSERCEVKAFDLSSHGTLTGRRVLRDGMTTGQRHDGHPDGMKCDEHGNVWVTGPGGVWILRPDGTVIGRIETPEQCANLCWGGRDLRTLFLTTRSSVVAIPTRCTCAPLPHLV